MCNCFDVSDFVCFFTFFITAIVALLFVQYFFVYLDFETDDKTRTIYLGRCMYFFILTLLGCLVFAGVLRRSIFLLKWPSRILVLLITAGIIFLTFFLWILDRVHKQTVRNLEAKSVKLSLVIVLLVLYLFGVQKLILLIRMSNANVNFSFAFDQVYNHSEDLHPPSSQAIDQFKARKGIALHSVGCDTLNRKHFNADCNGINHYKMLLEGNTAPSKCSSINKLNTVCSLAKFGKSGEISQV